MKNEMNSQSVKDENNVTGNTEIEQMKKMIADQQKQIELLIKQSNKTGASAKSKNVTNQDISPNAYVKIMSLIDHEMNLSTENFGKGKTLTFEHFGEVKKCLYSELVAIIYRHKNFFEQGKFYVLDDGRGVISELGYDDVYEHILTKDKIERILDSNPEAFNLFQSANTGQQKIIVDMLIKKVRDGGAVDHNLIAEISRFSGIKIEDKIDQAIEDTRFEEELMKNGK
jgi:hypothetical protein